MLHSEYAEAFALSRNYKNRTLEDEQKLYKYISNAVKEAQDPNHPTAKEAVNFVTKVYEPFLRKVAKSAFNNVKRIYEYEDALQETVAYFLKLLYKYNATQASFSYYINKFLPHYMKIWSTRVSSRHSAPIKTSIMEVLIMDSAVEVSDYSDFFDIPILEKEYIAFIIKRSHRESKSDTMKTVCNEYFLGNKSCSDIARSLGISYHAVYEIINKIKVELIEFLKESKYFEYHETSTGKIVIGPNWNESVLSQVFDRKNTVG